MYVGTFSRVVGSQRDLYEQKEKEEWFFFLLSVILNLNCYIQSTSYRADCTKFIRETDCCSQKSVQFL